jgi:hypothetical protein
LFLRMLGAALAQMLAHDQHCHRLHRHVHVFPEGGNELRSNLTSVSQGALGASLWLPFGNSSLNSLSQVGSPSSFASSTRGFPPTRLCSPKKSPHKLWHHGVACA